MSDATKPEVKEYPATQKREAKCPRGILWTPTECEGVVLFATSDIAARDTSASEGSLASDGKKVMRCLRVKQPKLPKMAPMSVKYLTSRHVLVFGGMPFVETKYVAHDDGFIADLRPVLRVALNRLFQVTKEDPTTKQPVSDSFADADYTLNKFVDMGESVWGVSMTLSARPHVTTTPNAKSGAYWAPLDSRVTSGEAAPWDEFLELLKSKNAPKRPPSRLHAAE